MRTLNKIMLVGRLGRDPEIRQPNGEGTPWGVLSVATNRARRSGEGWVEETDWHQVKVFGREAEYALRALRKGSLLSVEGSVTYEKWKSADGQKHVVTRILADRIGLLANASAEKAAAVVTDAPGDLQELGDDAVETLPVLHSEVAAEAK